MVGKLGCDFDDVCNSQAAAWFEDAVGVGVDLCLVRGQVDDAVGHDYVHAPVRNGQVLDLPEAVPSQ